MVPLSFFKQKFHATPEGALYWDSENALIVADLHLEKASWYASHGQMLPPYDSVETLNRLARQFKESGATQIWCLGDNFHDDDGEVRLCGEAADLLRELTAKNNWIWVTGNHDENIIAHWGGRTAREIERHGIIFRHEAEPDDLRPEFSGHYHPKLRVSARGRSISSPCFIESNHKVIMPAFGSLTGGLDAAHPEIAKAVGTPANAIIIRKERALKFPVNFGNSATKALKS